MSSYIKSINSDVRGIGFTIIALFILNILAGVYYFGNSIVSDSLFTDDTKYINASLTPTPDIEANYLPNYANYLDKLELTEGFLAKLWIALNILFSILSLVFLWRIFFGENGLLRKGNKEGMMEE